jgi:hypothetical protein
MDVLAYVVIPGNAKGKRIGIVKFGESGYYQTDYDPCDSIEGCRQQVRYLNERLGVSEEVEESMFAGSMFGWHVPYAERARIYAASVVG